MSSQKRLLSKEVVVPHEPLCFQRNLRENQVATGALALPWTMGSYYNTSNMLHRITPPKVIASAIVLKSQNY